ncbi:MAG: hypothetical protein U0670_10615 [Anaerolineae bacterium]
MKPLTPLPPIRLGGGSPSAAAVIISPPIFQAERSMLRRLTWHRWIKRHPIKRHLIKRRPPPDPCRQPFSAALKRRCRKRRNPQRPVRR